MVHAPEVGCILRENPVLPHLRGQQPDPTPCVEKGIDSVHDMGMLEDREEPTWLYLLPGWEPQSAVGMGSEPPPQPCWRVHRRGHGNPCTGCEGERRGGQGRPWLTPP